MQGYVVFSVEHTDGTASAAHLAQGGGWLFYQGWGSEEGRMAQTRYHTQDFSISGCTLLCQRFCSQLSLSNDMDENVFDLL